MECAFGTRRAAARRSTRRSSPRLITTALSTSRSWWRLMEQHFPTRPSIHYTQIRACSRRWRRARPRPADFRQGPPSSSRRLASRPRGQRNGGRSRPASSRRPGQVLWGTNTPTMLMYQIGRRRMTTGSSSTYISSKWPSPPDFLATPPVAKPSGPRRPLAAAVHGLPGASQAPLQKPDGNATRSSDLTWTVQDCLGMLSGLRQESDCPHDAFGGTLGAERFAPRTSPSSGPLCGPPGPVW